MKDIMKIMKQAQDMQARMQQMQADLQALEIEGQSGAGMVRVTLNGKGDVRAVKIDPKLMVAGEGEILEDLIVAAFRDAKTKVEAAAQARMQEITAGLPLPPGLKLF